MEKKYVAAEASRAPPAAAIDQFPAGLRVLVVDDDKACLKIMEKMLTKCLYRVITCCKATVALSMLRDKKSGFDIVISDVHMPDMDGYKLLEHVGLEMDLPVIMMSADGETCSVMRGIKHGACDYLIKPVRIEELKNIWQHVVRKKCTGNKGQDHSDSAEDTEQHQQAGDGAEFAASFVNNTGTDGSWKAQKKRRDVREDEGDGELDDGDPSMPKKPRVVWSVELHMKFVNAADQLGIDKAVPKRILELMNEPGLTRENVASHLQKFRLYLKKLNGASQQPDATAAGSFGGPREIIESRGSKFSAVGRADLQPWASLGQIPSPTTLAPLRAELFGRPTARLFLPGTNQQLLHHASIQGFQSFPIEGGSMPIYHPKLDSQSSTSKLFSQSSISFEDIPSAFLAWVRSHLGSEASASCTGGLTTYNSNHYGQILCQQRQQLPLVHPEPGNTVSLQTSCLISAPHSSNNFWTQNNNSILTNRSSSIGDSIDYSMSLLSPKNASLGSVPDRDLKNVVGLGGCSLPELGSSSQSVSSGLFAERGIWLRKHDAITNMNSSSRLLGPVSNICKIPPVKTRPAVLEERVQSMDRGFVGKGTSIQGLFPVDQPDSASDNESMTRICT